MKKLFYLMICLVCIQLQTFAQPCPADTLAFTVSPFYAMDTATLSDSTLQCYNYRCSVDACHYWQLPASFTGHLSIYTTSGIISPITVQIWSECRYIHLDTCFTLSDPADAWGINARFPANCQIAICDSFLPMTILIKPGPPFDSIPPAIVDTDTLCGAMGVEMIELYRNPPRYFDPLTLQEVEFLEPFRTYLKR